MPVTGNDTSGDIRGVDIEEALKKDYIKCRFLSCPNGGNCGQDEIGRSNSRYQRCMGCYECKRSVGELTMEHVNCQLIHAPEEKCRWLHLRDIK